MKLNNEMRVFRARWTKRVCLGLITVAAAATLSAQTSGPILKTLYNFTRTNGDGGFPFAGVTLGKGGVLYGTTSASSPYVLGGTVYSLTPPASPGGAWTETVLYGFPDNGATGNDPVGGVVVAKSGVLYGTTQSGGAFGHGTVFSLAPPASLGGSWTQTVLYSFTGGSDGALPTNLVQGGGVLYGTTFSGGPGGNAGNGVVFSLTPPASAGGSWTETTLYSFQGGNDGTQPAGVVVGSGGVLYGTTQNGGGALACTNGCGTVFSLSPPAAPGGSWTETLIHTFTSGPNDGAFVKGGVVIGAGGVLFGATQGGGTTAGGVVYSLTPPASAGGSWTEAILYNFNNQSGTRPSTVTIGSGGVLYGASRGNVFSLAPPSSPGSPWTEKNLHTFTGSDGILVNGNLVIGHGGVIYGTTNEGGSTGNGTVFSLMP